MLSVIKWHKIKIDFLFVQYLPYFMEISKNKISNHNYNIAWWPFADEKNLPKNNNYSAI